MGLDCKEDFSMRGISTGEVLRGGIFLEKNSASFFFRNNFPQRGVLWGKSPWMGDFR